LDFAIFSESGVRRHARTADAYQDDLDEIILADELGFKEAWIAETNQVRPNTVTHAHMLMCKAAPLTKHIRFGSGIRQLPLHHPVDVVQEANMCDNVTRGRYTFGYGGTHLVSHEQMRMRGIEASHQDTRAMVHESIEIILKCWTSEEPFDFEGRYWHGRDVNVTPRPFQQPHPPIAAGCSGSADTIELAARHGFIPLFGRGSDPAEELREWGELYLRTARAAGQPLSRKAFHVAHVIWVAETDGQARDQVREGLTYKLSTVDPAHLMKRIPPGGTLDDLTFDYLVDTGYYWVGSPDTVYEQIREYYDACDGFGVLMLFAGMPLAEPSKVARSLQLFAQDVAPRLASGRDAPYRLSHAEDTPSYRPPAARRTWSEDAHQSRRHAGKSVSPGRERPLPRPGPVRPCRKADQREPRGFERR